MQTDFYQITMAYAHWKRGTQNTLASFQMFYRTPPFEAQDQILFCGLETAINYIKNFSFSEKDLDYFKELNLFETDFLNYLSRLRFTGNLEAFPEGTWVKPHEAMLKITGPIVECQILETPLLNILNFQTLIATKATRICKAAEGDPVIEFGLRRAQGLDGAFSASRSAYIGGCSGTSNLEAAIQLGIPVRGTLSHAWILSFESELEAFQAYANIFPDSCTLLVDTYDTLEGVKKAIQLGSRLKAIRLDSGDLLYLSKESRRLLDQAGLYHVGIMASSDLDEYRIATLKKEGAPINSWGVGTRLITAFEEPALNGVYKLVSIQDPETKVWRNCYKQSNDISKATPITLFSLPNQSLISIFESGACVYESPQLEAIRQSWHPRR